MTQAIEIISDGDVVIQEVTLDDLLTGFLIEYQAVSPEEFNQQQQSAAYGQGSPAVSSLTDSDQGRLLQSPYDAVQATSQEKRKKNSEAAKASRRKKKEQEHDMKERLKCLEIDNKAMKKALLKYKSMYLNSLSHLQTKMAFCAYLRQNRELVRDPEARPVLQQFMTTGYPLLFGV